MDILNDDFASPATTTTADALRTFYMATVQPTQALAQQDHRDSEHDHLLDARALAAEQRAQEGKAGPAASLVLNTWVLMERLALNYSRSVLLARRHPLIPPCLDALCLHRPETCLHSASEVRLAPV